MQKHQGGRDHPTTKGKNPTWINDRKLTHLKLSRSKLLESLFKQNVIKLSRVLEEMKAKRKDKFCKYHRVLGQLRIVMSLKHIIHDCIEKGPLIEYYQLEILKNPFSKHGDNSITMICESNSFYPQDEIIPLEFVHNN